MLDLVRFVSHRCRVAGLQRQTNTFLNLLWDGCEMAEPVSLTSFPVPQLAFSILKFPFPCSFNSLIGQFELSGLAPRQSNSILAICQ